MPHPRTLFFGAAAGDGTPGVSPGAAESGWQPRTLGPPAGAKAPPTPSLGPKQGFEHRSNASANTRAPFFGGNPFFGRPRDGARNRLAGAPLLRLSFHRCLAGHKSSCWLLGAAKQAATGACCSRASVPPQHVPRTACSARPACPTPRPDSHVRDCTCIEESGQNAENRDGQRASACAELLSFRRKVRHCPPPAHPPALLILTITLSTHYCYCIRDGWATSTS